jgi:S1-C subfamily serine protease
MIRFSCPACKKLLQATLQQSGVKMSCPGCDQRLQVPAPPRNKTILGDLVTDGNHAPSPAAAAAPAPNPYGTSPWYFSQNKQRKGPVSWEQLRQMAAARLLDPKELVWAQGMANWVPAQTVTGLYPASPAANDRATAGRGGPSRGRRLWKWAAATLGAACLGLLAILVLGLGNRSTTSAQESQEQRLNATQIFNQASPSVALIAHKHATGSGFVVRPGLVVTNAHVTMDGPLEDLKVYFSSDDPDMKNPIPVERVVYYDRNRDLAVLKIKSPKPALKVADRYTFQPGEDVITIGNPGAMGQLMKNAVSKGVLSTKAKVRGLEWYQVTMAINGGNSGGPVFDSTGQVIGVVSFGQDGKEGINFLVSCEAVNQVIAQVERQTEEESLRQNSHNNQVAVFRRSFSVSLRAILDMKQALKVAATRQNPKAYLAQFATTNAKVFQDWDRLLQEVKPTLDRLASDPAAKETYPKLLELWNTAQALKTLLQTAGTGPETLGGLQLTLLGHDLAAARLAKELKTRLKQEDLLMRGLFPDLR